MGFASEAAKALYGAWRFAWLDPGALAFFDRTVDACKRSFLAGAFAYPFFLIYLPLSLSASQWEKGDTTHIIAIETMRYVIAWAGFPLLLLPLTRMFGREHVWVPFVTIYNWTQLLQFVVLIGALGLTGGASDPRSLGAGFLAIVQIAVLLYEFAVVRIALDVTSFPAAIIVAADIAFGETLVIIARMFYAPSP